MVRTGGGGAILDQTEMWGGTTRCDSTVVGNTPRVVERLTGEGQLDLSFAALVVRGSSVGQQPRSCPEHG